MRKGVLLENKQIKLGVLTKGRNDNDGDDDDNR